MPELRDPIRPPRLSRGEADEIESELRRLETDAGVSKTELRLFLQLPMPCGHAVGNLLTCSDPPYGCVICGEPVSERNVMPERPEPTAEARCLAEIAEAEALLRAGHVDMEGLYQALKDWRAELRLLRGEEW